MWYGEFGSGGGVLQPLWWHWVVLGTVLIVAELALTQTFFIFWFGLAAVLTGLVMLLLAPLTLNGQLLLWLILSLLTVTAWFGYFRRAIGARRLKAASADIVGEVGLVVKGVKGRGWLRFQKPVAGRDVWSFSSRQPLTRGERARVVAVGDDGLLIVDKLTRESQAESHEPHRS